MRTLYIDCGMGAAGDMLTAALLELLPEPDKMVERFNGLGIPGVCFEKEESVKCGITGTRVAVTVYGREEDDYGDEDFGDGDSDGEEEDLGDGDSDGEEEDLDDGDSDGEEEDLGDGDSDGEEEDLDDGDSDEEEEDLDDGDSDEEEGDLDDGDSDEEDEDLDDEESDEGEHHGHGHHHGHGYHHGHEHRHGHGYHHHEHHREHGSGHEHHHHHHDPEHRHEHHHSHEHGHGHEHGHEHGHHHEHGYRYGHERNYEREYRHDHEYHSGGHHHHSSLRDIEHIVRDRLPISDRVKDDVMAVYHLIAEAEGSVHGVPVTDIHFHEVGTMDALADITAVCMLMEELAPERVVVSPVHVGSGQVRCAHGILPVPAPATAHILRDVPIYGGSVRGELCTPTGAALLRHFASVFGDMPVMTVQAIGYGMGKKDFDAANCVRVLLGETTDAGDTVAELFCNIDDMSAEAVGFATEVLFAAGALEVYTVPVGMKKSRPGILLCTMCRMEDRDKMIRLIFRHTTTIGVREQISRRHTLERKVETVETAYGAVRKKVSGGYGVRREKYEYEDLAEIARREDKPISEILGALPR